MKKFTILFSVFLFAFFIHACREDNKPEEKKEALEAVKSSELAVMMREMHEYAGILRKSLHADSLSELPPYHGDWEFLKTSIPTDPDVRTPVFNELSDMFVKSVEDLRDNKDGRIFRYNHMLNACVSCHQTYCPGPIKKINKLRI